MSLALYGNLIHDKIYNVKNCGVSSEIISKSERGGGVINVARAYRYLNPSDKIKICASVGGDFFNRYNAKLEIDRLNIDSSRIEIKMEMETSEAIILCEGQNKQSYVKWGACETHSNFEPVGARWNHFCYIDHLPYLTVEDLKKFGGVVSADLCKNLCTTQEVKLVLSLLPHIDYLFVSDAELEAFSISPINLSKLVRKAIVAHTPYSINVITPQKQIVTFAQKEYNIKCVLGAGDYLVASFINNWLTNPDKMSFEHIHSQTAELLLKLNEET